MLFIFGGRCRGRQWNEHKFSPCSTKCCSCGHLCINLAIIFSTGSELSGQDSLMNGLVPMFIASIFVLFPIALDTLLINCNLEYEISSVVSPFSMDTIDAIRMIGPMLNGLTTLDISYSRLQLISKVS